MAHCADGTDSVKNFVFSAKLRGGLIARPVIGKKRTGLHKSSGQILISSDDKLLKVPHSYSTENWEAQRICMRESISSPGYRSSKDGTIVVATRSTGIWRIRDRSGPYLQKVLMRHLGLL